MHELSSGLARALSLDVLHTVSPKAGALLVARQRVSVRRLSYIDTVRLCILRCTHLAPRPNPIPINMVARLVH